MRIHPFLQPAMDPAVLAHMRQQMGAAAAAGATAAVAAQGVFMAKAVASLSKMANAPEVDKTKLHFRECAGEKWVDTSLSEWPESALAPPPSKQWPCWPYWPCRS